MGRGSASRTSGAASGPSGAGPVPDRGLLLAAEWGAPAPSPASATLSWLLSICRKSLKAEEPEAVGWLLGPAALVDV